MSGHSENRLNELAELPRLEPPAELEPRTLAAMAKASRGPGGYRLAAAAGWIAILGAAALLALFALDADSPSEPETSLAATGAGEPARGAVAASTDAPPADVAGTDSTGGDSSGADAQAADAAAADDAAGAERYYALLAEAARLEQLLYELPPPRRVIRVSTAGTIVGLEERIALLDAELIRATAESDPPEYRTALLRERVDAMGALVNVRYAQSRAFNF